MQVMSPYRIVEEGKVVALGEDYPGVKGYEDKTGTPPAQVPPDPNQVVVFVQADQAVLDAIEADPLYSVLPKTRALGVGDEDPALDDIPSQPDFTAWRKVVLDCINPATGRPWWTAGQFNKAVGNQPDGRTWRQLHTALNDSLKAAFQIVPASDYTVTAAGVGGANRGYDAAMGGSIAPSTEWRGMTITRLAIDTTGRVDLEMLPTGVDDNNKETFKSLVVNGVELLSLAADYTPEVQRWRWNGTAVTRPDSGAQVGLSFVLVDT